MRGCFEPLKTLDLEVFGSLNTYSQGIWKTRDVDILNTYTQCLCHRVCRILLLFHCFVFFETILEVMPKQVQLHFPDSDS